MSLRLLLLISTTLAGAAGPALAQDRAPSAPQPRTDPPAASAPEEEGEQDQEAANLEDVVVNARATAIRSSIDSTTYSLADDLQAATGSLAEALRNIPSVDVDPQGNVSLRGDPNVTILVDGRPSGVLTGEGRAQALLQLPADQYSRIEVMTNPSAAYSPEGSGGVINLITKPSAARPGVVTTGSVRANIGDDGRWNLGLSGSWSRDRLTLSGDIGARHDLALQTFDRSRDRLDPATGDPIETTRQLQTIEGEVDVQFGRLNADFRLSDRIQLTGELRGSNIDNGGDGFESYQTSSPDGAPIGRYSRDSDFSFRGRNAGATGRLVRRFDDQGHEWTGELRLDRGRGHFSLASAYDFERPSEAPGYERLDNRNRLNLVGFTSAYVRPMPDEARLRAGYELEHRQVRFDNGRLRGDDPDQLTPDVSFTNRFEADQSVHALYATYERPFGNLSAQLGLRVEYAELDLDQVTTGEEAGQDYLRAYPTLHLGYQLSDNQQLKASYSRRIQRPAPFQLNPFTSFQDPLNRRSGNPDLEPQETDSFELMWQLRSGQTFYQATAYLRDTDKAFTDVATDIGGGVLLTRPENLGSRRDLGVELVANGQLHSTLRYNASLNLFRQEIDGAGLLGGEDRSGTVVSGRASLNWQPTQNDFLQISGQWQGDALLAQGVRESGGILNLGYRRKIDEKLALLVTVRDVLDDFGDVTTFETDAFRDRTERTFGGRAWYVGLTYAFGQGPRRAQEPQFDFSTPQTGG